ncbi:hypothetical protein LR48_Vigan11g018700 [Vigna angularis]|nr:hypothetical protein LR48_Vigan11g018700 [Vigna angularis]
MEPFNFLKYWKGAANATPNDPFFDLELALTDEDDSQDDTNGTQNDDDDDAQDQDHNNQSEPDSDSDSDSEKEFNFTLSPSASSDHPTISLSPSHHLVFDGNILLNSQPNSKPHFTASFFKSATKLRVFMLGLKKPKPNAHNKQPNTHPKKKLFTVNFKVEEVPIVSFFTRDNSSRAKPSNTQNADQTEPSHAQIEDKRSMPKYLKMVKPLYVRVSKRYAEKLRFSDQVEGTSPESAPPCSTVQEKSPTEAEGSQTEGAAPANVKGQKQGNVPLPAGLRKHLGKGRATTPPPPPQFESSKRRDDSLLQQHDWIQGAILHCKRSFNAASECESSEVPRSASDPLGDVSPELSEKSTTEKCL